MYAGHGGRSGAMDRYAQIAFLQELITQCQLALAAANAVNGTLQVIQQRQQEFLARLNQSAEGSLPPNDVSELNNPLLDEQLHREVFRHIHSFLTHASNVSKLLWPIIGHGHERRHG